MTPDPRSYPESPALASAGRLEFLAGLVTLFALLFILASAGGGVAVALISDRTPSLIGGAGTTTHPYIAVGVGIALAGIFQATVVLMVAGWARTYALSVQFT